MTWDFIRGGLGHFHPALVHFPVALITAGAALEAWFMLRRRPQPSESARVMLLLGALGVVAAVASGLALFHPGDFQGRTLDAARIHRYLGIVSLFAILAASAVGTLGRGGFAPSLGGRLKIYRALLLASGILIGLTGHYGGWVVFGWGWLWTP
ncbi:MAG: hypothetical protein MUP25_01090 [Syntrophales bacterium]|nr:hypothetical protein [Syntrophales bacterium]